MSMDHVQSDSPVSAAPPAAPGRPLWARGLAIVTSPRSVFEELAARPRWFWTTMLICVVAAIVFFLLWNSVMAPFYVEQASKSPQMTPETLAQMERNYASPVSRIVGSFFAGFANFFFIVLAGLVYFAITSFLMGGKARVKQALAVSAHASLVHIPRALLIMPLAIARQDPAVSLGPGLLFPASEAVGFGAKFLAKFLGAFDLFNIWSTALSILGMSVVSRIPTRQVAIAIVSTFLGLAILFSLLGAALQPQ
jgi:hypothetical protein